MTETSARFALPFLLPAQAQKEVYHNEALAMIDALLHPVVEGPAAATPPPAPEVGRCWIVAAGATGAWTGAAGKLAIATSGGWRFMGPVPGLLSWDRLAARWLQWDGSAWGAAFVGPHSIAAYGGTFAERLVAAAAASTEVLLEPGADYTADRLIDLSGLPGRTIRLNGATISAAPGFADTHMLAIRGDTRLIGPGTVDGTNVPPPAAAASAVAGISKSASGVATVTTSTPHGLRPGEVVEFAGVGGMTELNLGTNGPRFAVLNPTSTTFDIGSLSSAEAVDTSGYGSHTSGGTVTRPAADRGAAYRGVGVFVTGGGASGSIEGLLFRNFAAGPVKTDSRHPREGFAILRCRAENVCSFTGAETNPAFALDKSSRGLIADCVVSGHKWRAFRVGGGSLNRIARCHAEGGREGQASHAIAGGADNVIEACTHAGSGSGFEVALSARPVVRDFVAADADAGGLVRGCQGFLVDGLKVEGPVRGGLSIEGAVGSPVSGLARDIQVRRSAPGTTSDHLGVRVAAVPGTGGEIAGVTIRDCRFENTLWGVWLANEGGAHRDIAILANRFVNVRQYGVLGYLGSGEISGNLFQMAGTGVEASIFLSRDSGTTDGEIQISDNQLTGARIDNIQINDRAAWKAVRLLRNRGSDGVRWLNLDCGNNAADSLGLLEVVGNAHSGLAAAFAITAVGCAFEFNGTAATVLRNEGNMLCDAAFVPVPDTYAVTTNLTITGSLRHSGAPEGLFKARIGTVCYRTDGGAGSALYVKESPTGNTGWVGK